MLFLVLSYFLLVYKTLTLKMTCIFLFMLINSVTCSFFYKDPCVYFDYDCNYYDKDRYDSGPNGSV